MTSNDLEIKNKLVELYLKQSWLIEHENPLEVLLKPLRNVRQRKQILNLLFKFRYVTYSDRSQSIYDLKEYLVDSTYLTSENSVISGLSFDSEPDSSHAVLQTLKYFLAETRLMNIDMSVKIPDSIKKAKKKEYLILVDEFSGTGDTIISRFNSIKNELKNQKIEHLNIQVILLAAMEKALVKIRSNHINVISWEILKPAIQSIQIKREKKYLYLLNSLLENTLLPKINNTDLPNLGYGSSESMFSTERQNPPNNNLSILWWPYNKDGSMRESLLKRAQKY
ncbi:phosphoribosyltransferase-like protein [Leptospira terpstrae]|uniref:phosphoribosyltransferase-like protein n=1 Tax=Leptospira terpstrae TaxID=293075 RepID=UPI003D06745A